MLIDPLGKKIEVNVEQISNYLENEHQLATNLKGYQTSKFKGSVYRIEIKGTIYGENKDTIYRYMESISFDDVIQIEIDITDNEIDTTNNVIIPRNEKIEGFLIIMSFAPNDIFKGAISYTINGYFFPLDKYELKTISSYFNLPAVSATVTTGSLVASNSTQNVSLVAGEWDHIIVGNFQLKPINYTNQSVLYRVFAEAIDIGPNVAKIQLNTCIDENGEYGPIVDISYIVVNRGGFKLLTNIAWEITGVSPNAIFKTDEGIKDYVAKLPLNVEIGSNSALLIDNLATYISNYDSFYWDADSLGNPQLFSGTLKTKIVAGNTISIATSAEYVQKLPGSISAIPTGKNIQVVSPQPASNVPIITEGADKVVYVPIEFVINDGSLVDTIDIKLKLGYSPVTWDFVIDIDTITSFDPQDYKNGGYLNAKFILPSNPPAYYMHAGIEIIAHYTTGGHEHGLTKFTFSIGWDPSATIMKIGGNGPVYQMIDLKNNTVDYPIIPLTGLDNGLYDVYFYFDVNYGKCVVDLGLYSGDLTGAYLESQINDAWRTVMDDYMGVIGIVPLLPASMPTFGEYNCVDYNAGGMNYVMKDNTSEDPGVPSKALFKRTILIKDTTDTWIHARLTNYGSSTITALNMLLVPQKSHVDGVHFLGDHIVASAPNIKNSILIPK